MDQIFELRLTKEQLYSLQDAVKRQGEGVKWTLSNKKKEPKIVAFLNRRLQDYRDIYAQISEHIPEKKK